MRIGYLLLLSILTNSTAFAQSSPQAQSKAPAEAQVNRDGVISVSIEAAAAPGEESWTWTVPSKRWEFPFSLG